MNAGHDGAAVAIKDRKLICSLESEKDSFRRHQALTASTILSLLEQIDEKPDVVALGGWMKDAGKLMALAAFARADEADKDITRTIQRILEEPVFYPAPKSAYRDCPVYNIGVEAQPSKIAAAFMTERLFDIYADFAKTHI